MSETQHTAPAQMQAANSCCLSRLVRLPVAFVLARVYGVRGAIKPPIGGCRLYRIRYRLWSQINRLYRWSGLPERWATWYTRNAEDDCTCYVDDTDLGDDGEEDLTCPHCSGTGGEPLDDGITPCEYCDGEGYLYWM
mgnify:CR=1 FL=1